MILDAKGDFKKGTHKSAFHDLSGSAVLHEAIKTALLTMQAGFPTVSDMSVAAANHLRMEGARAFVAVLLNLTEEPKKPEPDRTQNLNHKL